MTREYQLRRIDNNTALYQFIAAEGSWTWEWNPGCRPVGRMQWYQRQPGMRRWFKYGPVVEYP